MMMITAKIPRAVSVVVEAKLLTTIRISQITYLDRRTGEVNWVYETDDGAYMEAGIPADENRQERERVVGNPDRYLKIPGLDHGDHHSN